jgi:hypothetical protein
MMPSQVREMWLRSLLDDVCRTVRWTAPLAAGPDETLREAFRALELRVAVKDGELIASVDDEMTLRIRVSASRWSGALERALHDGLKQSGSPLAELVLLDWSEIQRGGRNGLPDSETWTTSIGETHRRPRR